MTQNEIIKEAEEAIVRRTIMENKALLLTNASMLERILSIIQEKNIEEVRENYKVKYTENLKTVGNQFNDDRNNNVKKMEDVLDGVHL